MKMLPSKAERCNVDNCLVKPSEGRGRGEICPENLTEGQAPQCLPSPQPCKRPLFFS
ncbi:unnamed protein product [Gulo gulo]|uniref:Uncharacterized protein n=1 Tax=Gulo gulo TaxID=48420 RepID=A0A9X9LIM8_GULGU|nr:unnamed protein product [Gulo gulo]